MANQRKSGSAAQNKRTKIIVTAVVIAVALLITFAPYMNLPFDIPTWGELLSGDEQTIQSGDAFSQPFTVHVIDVGQGDHLSQERRPCHAYRCRRARQRPGDT